MGLTTLPSDLLIFSEPLSHQPWAKMLCGIGSPIACTIEHALSAYFDITHGAGLAVITPRWMKEILSERTAERFVTLGKGLFCFDQNLSDMEMANEVIDAFYAFFEEIGIPMHLGELGVKADKIDEMADHILEFDSTNEPWMYAPSTKPPSCVF